MAPHESSRMRGVRPGHPDRGGADPPASRDDLARAGRRALRPAAAGAGDASPSSSRDPENHKYQPVRRHRAAARTLAREAGPPRTASHVRDVAPPRRHRRREHGVHQRGPRRRRPRRRSHPAVALLLQPRDGRDDRRLHGRCSCRRTGDYQLRLDAIRAAITPRTRAVVTVSPNNPTGAVYPESALREVNALCREQAFYHVSRRSVRVLHLGRRRALLAAARSPAASAHTICLYSLSKAYGFASWRIG